MKIYFTWEDKGNKNRVKYLRGALWRNGHRIAKKAPDRLPENAVWMFGLSHKILEPLPARTLSFMERAPGNVFFYQTNDENNFGIDRIPNPNVVSKALFLRNHWPSDIGRIPESIRGKTGFINPLIKPCAAKPGAPIVRRSVPILFYGVNTGSRNVNRSCREEAMRRIRAAKLPLTGGLVRHPEYQTPADLLVEAISPREHDRLLSDTRICLALWGNCPLTYRLFEGLSRRCFVVTPSLSSIRFADGGLSAGSHYVEVKPDLSDLVETLEYYLTHPDEAQRIADSGHRHFLKVFQFRGVDLPQPLYREIAASWRGRLAEAHPGWLWRTAASGILPLLKSV
jgi:hypothetical protein